jgi:hypothetical protein
MQRIAAQISTGTPDKPLLQLEIKNQEAAFPYLHRCDDLSKSERGRPRLPEVFKTVSSDLVASLGQNAKARTVAWDLRARIAQGWAAALEQ